MIKAVIICSKCKKPYIEIGNLKADTFQEYIADCDCKADAIKDDKQR